MCRPSLNVWPIHTSEILAPHTHLLPNKFASGSNFVRANTTESFPGTNDEFTFDIAGPAGLNQVLARASTEELDLNDVAQFKDDQQTDFATVTVTGGQTGLALALSIIVTPLASKDWVTDVAQYRIPSTVTAPPVAVVTTTTFKTSTWKSSFRSGLTLKRVYDLYVNQLQGQGYVADKTTGGRLQMVGNFSMTETMTASGSGVGTWAMCSRAAQNGLRCGLL